MDVLSEKVIPRGKVIVVRVKEAKITILLTNHLLDAAEDYNLEVKDVLYAVTFPDEV